jgi:hypothetical protein
MLKLYFYYSPLPLLPLLRGLILGDKLVTNLFRGLIPKPYLGLSIPLVIFLVEDDIFK